MTPEGRIKAYFSKGLKAIQERFPGRLWVRMPVTRGMGLPWLDYHLCAAGQTYAVETKKDVKTKPTPQQRHTMRELTEAGAKVMLVYDRDTADTALYRIEKELFHVYGPPIYPSVKTEQGVSGPADQGDDGVVPGG